ncbi:hypothetical protein BDZ89DRAFT_156614 [Hymenopellis radicata]|nr:hypothetical protein BDZ89DRAFT_156614 [Hymenopellis radicata]
MESTSASVELCPDAMPPFPCTAPYTSSRSKAFYTPFEVDISPIQNHLKKPSAELAVVAAGVARLGETPCGS